MSRTLLVALGTLLLVAGAVFWWQGHAAIRQNAAVIAAPSEQASEEPFEEALPSADAAGLEGPALPHATEQTREQRRFDHFDKDRDDRITRNELLAPRANDFRKLDIDGNNLLTFEEWATSTVNKFKGADADGDGALTRAEFATTRQKTKKPACKCK